MNKFLNYIIGKAILIIAKIRIRINKALRNNLNKVELSIDSSTQLPEKITNSIISIEDKRYYKHIGIDLYSIGRAICKYIFLRKLEGASTIEQQFIRNITNKRTISLKRKLNEICLAVLISDKFDKTTILNSYLKKYHFENAEGVIQLCMNEKINLSELTDYEAASIAARLKYPYIKTNNYIRYLKRVRTIEIKKTPNIAV